MAIYTGKWDCGSCGYKGVEGPETTCNNCGSPRPKDVQFYLADTSEIVQDKAELKKAKAGADWVCSYCRGHNKAYENNCSTCGNDREQKDGDVSLQVKEYTHKERSNSKTAIAPPIVPKKKSKKRLFLFLGLFVLVLIFLFGYSQPSTATIVDFEWERIIEVEQNREVEEEDWVLPREGRLISSRQAIHHYDKVLDHYETRSRTVREAVGTEEYVCGKTDMGNGFFEDKYCSRTLYENRQEDYEKAIYRKDPVYRKKYRYLIYRWKGDKPIVRAAKNHNPQWGNTQKIEQDPNKRVRNKKEIYTILVKDEQGKPHKHTIKLKRWMALKKGQSIKTRKGLWGSYKGLDESF